MVQYKSRPLQGNKNRNLVFLTHHLATRLIFSLALLFFLAEGSLVYY